MKILFSEIQLQCHAQKIIGNRKNQRKRITEIKNVDLAEMGIFREIGSGICKNYKKEKIYKNQGVKQIISIKKL